MLTATPGTPATITIPTPSAPPAGQRHPKLLNRLAETLRSRHCSLRTEQAYLREAIHDIRTIQELLGHTDVSAHMVYTPMLTKRDRRVRSPVEALPRRNRQSVYPGPQMSAPNLQRPVGKEVAGFSPRVQRGLIQTRSVYLCRFIQTVYNIVGNLKHECR